MPESINPALPAALRQRLDAAGVTDAASLERALEADESLRAEVEAFAAAQAAQQIEQLLSEFLSVASSNELIEFWNRVPPALEQPFLAEAEAQLIQAEQDGRQTTRPRDCASASAPCGSYSRPSAISALCRQPRAQC